MNRTHLYYRDVLRVAVGVNDGEPLLQGPLQIEYSGVLDGMDFYAVRFTGTPATDEHETLVMSPGGG